MRGKRDLRKRPSQKRLHELLDYDPDVGVFRWRVRRGPARAGSVAGWPTEWGYIRIHVDGFRVFAHELAVIYMTGRTYPHGVEVDHKDRDGTNNKWSNIRITTRRDNCVNRRFKRVGFVGVYATKYRRWEASIRHKGQIKHLGTFDDPVVAAYERDRWARRLHGRFAALNFPDD